MSLGYLQQTVLPRMYGRAHYLLFALVVGESLLFVFYGNSNLDEGWYMYASRLVFEGDIPYRDFAFFQGPVLPYIYGLPQYLLGPSLLVGRFTSPVFTLITVLMIAYLAYRLAGRAALLWALVLTFANPVLIYWCTLARSEAFVTALSVLALAALFRFRQGTPALLVAPALLLLAAGTRIVFIPAFLGVLAFVWWSTRAGQGQRLLAGGLLVSQAVILFGIPLLLAPQRAAFGLWSSQVSRGDQWTDRGAWDTFVAKAGQLDALWSTHLMVLIPAVVLAGYLIWRYYRGWEPRRARFGGDPLDNYVLILALAALIFAPHIMLFPIQSEIYFVPSSALLTVAVAAAAVRLPGYANLRALRSSFVLLLVMLILLGAPMYAARASRFVDIRSPTLVELSHVADVLSRHLDNDEPFVAFDIRLAVLAGRAVLRGLEMGHFSYWPTFSTDEVEDLRVLNRERLLEVIESNAPRVLALSDQHLTLIGATTPPDLLGPPEEEAPFRILPELKQSYALAETVRSNHLFGGQLYVLMRTGVPTYIPSEQ